MSDERPATPATYGTVHPQDDKSPDRDTLGRIVREAWVEWAREQPNPRPSWLVPWEKLGEADRDADRRIGEAVYAHAMREAQAPAAPLTDAEREELAVAFAEYRAWMGDPDPSSTEPAARLAAAVERASELNATAPPWFLVEDSDGAPLPQEALDVIWRLTEAIRLTQEFTGLPALPGWSWYDALAQYRPDLNLATLAGPR